MNNKTAKMLRRVAFRTADPTRKLPAKVKRMKRAWLAMNHKARGFHSRKWRAFWK